jgi:hypothetical protein
MGIIFCYFKNILYLLTYFIEKNVNKILKSKWTQIWKDTIKKDSDILVCLKLIAQLHEEFV